MRKEQIVARVMAILATCFFAYGVVRWFEGFVSANQDDQILVAVWNLQGIGFMLIGLAMWILAFLIDWRATSKPTPPPPPRTP